MIVGRVDGKLVVNPTVEQMEKSDIHLVVAGTYDAINMVEAGADQVPESVMLEAIMTYHDMIRKLVEFQNKIVAEIGKEKMVVVLHEVDPQVNQAVREYAEARLKEAIRIEEKQARYDAIDAIKAETKQHFAEANPETYAEQERAIDEVLYNIVKEEVRRLITEEKIRPDGRALNEIRPLSSETNILPRTHGSGLFTRGQTQALSVCTLGALGDVQILDGLGLEESKRFMHHYNFPPYSVGEARPLRPPGRREIGHGALGERAIEPIIPSETEFPYTIRLVSEVIESNGSTSQASICASVLALMDAGGADQGTCSRNCHGSDHGRRRKNLLYSDRHPRDGRPSGRYGFQSRRYRNRGYCDSDGHQDRRRSTVKFWSKRWNRQEKAV